MTKQYTQERIEELLVQLREMKENLSQYNDIQPHEELYERYCTAQTTLAIATAKLTALQRGNDG